MQTKERKSVATGGVAMVTSIKNDFVNGTWKAVLSAFLGSIITIVGWSYVQGKNDATVEARLTRLEEQFSEANISLKEIARTLQTQNTQYLELQHQLDDINDRASSRWSSQDQQIFALQLQLKNQDIDVPSVDDILRSRTMP